VDYIHPTYHRPAVRVFARVVPPIGPTAVSSVGGRPGHVDAGERAAPRLTRHSIRFDPGSTLDLAGRRCAAGEITKEEFEQMRNDLG
jgi:hypothetical protein